MSFAEHTLGMISEIAGQIELPRVRQFLLSRNPGESDRSSKFGILLLEGGEVGLTYVDIEDARAKLCGGDISARLIGCTVAEVATWYLEQDCWRRVVGMAAVNAISQFVLKTSGFVLNQTQDSLDHLDIQPADCVGMVGFFPPLVERIRNLGVNLYVIELDPKWIQQSDGLLVTHDTSMLTRCNKIICTGTAMINGSIDDVLRHCSEAEKLIVVGPSTGCLPDVLFEKGVTAVGGRQISDTTRFLDKWRQGQGWHAASLRYLIDCQSYPGYHALVKRINAE